MPVNRREIQDCLILQKKRNLSSCIPTGKMIIPLKSEVGMAWEPFNLLDPLGLLVIPTAHFGANTSATKAVINGPR